MPLPSMKRPQPAPLSPWGEGWGEGAFANHAAGFNMTMSQKTVLGFGVRKRGGAGRRDLGRGARLRKLLAGYA